MTEKNLNDAPATETLADGSTVERDVRGTIVKITNKLGKEYTARNLSTKADAELVKRVEDFRWANQMSVAEFVTASVTAYLGEAEPAKA